MEYFNKLESTWLIPFNKRIYFATDYKFEAFHANFEIFVFKSMKWQKVTLVSSSYNMYYHNVSYHIYTYKTWILCFCVSVCVSVCIFRSYQKSQLHEISAQGIIWANLKHDKARFLNFSFLQILDSKMMCLFMISSAIKHHSYLKFWI